MASMVSLPLENLKVEAIAACEEFAVPATSAPVVSVLVSNM